MVQGGTLLEFGLLVDLGGRSPPHAVELSKVFIKKLQKSIILAYFSKDFSIGSSLILIALFAEQGEKQPEKPTTPLYET